MSHILVFIGFQTKCREVIKATTITRSVKPLEEAPQEAKREELSQQMYLLPKKRKEFKGN